MSDLGIPVSAVLDEETRKRLIEDNQYTYFPSCFEFLKQSHGLRPGQMHLLLGTPGSGKSTLARSILLDLLPSIDTNVLCWLSEETAVDFQLGLQSYKQENFEKIKILSEEGLDKSLIKNHEALKAHFEKIVSATNPRVLFFDNLTTSMLYMEKKPEVQADTARWLKGFCQKMQIPFFLVAHTKKDINDTSGKIITGNDIRGSAAITNLLAYMYVFQRLKVKETFYPTIYIEKSRHHRAKRPRYFLVYNPDLNSYTSDRSISFDEFKENYKSSNKLGGA